MNCVLFLQKTASILLLSGPTGAGKTATVSVICKNLGIKVSEWITPTDVEYAVENGKISDSRQSSFLTIMVL